MRDLGRCLVWAALAAQPLASPSGSPVTPTSADSAAAGDPAALADLRSAHEVRSLPGVEGPFGPHYSGYLPVEGGLEIFYYFAPHPDKSKPFIAWMNGGPGASSFSGLFTELGPFLLNQRSIPNAAEGKGWQLFRNPHGWNHEGSLLGWEQPAGVGFSRCRIGPCPTWNDTTATEANLRFLLAFFELFPEERARKFFIAGESYGGIYVPLLAARVWRHNAEAPEAQHIQLHGIAVGNGCVGYGVEGGCGTDSLELFVTVLEQGAPRVSRDVLADVRASCEGQLNNGLMLEQLTGRCKPAYVRLLEEAAYYNEYHMGSPCGPDGLGNWGDGASFTCGAPEALSKYVSEASVQCALHVIPCDNKTKPLSWQEWDGDFPYYNITTPDVQPEYVAFLAGGLRVLIYYGLRDTSVPAIGGEKWVPRLAGAVSEPRRHWSGPDGSLAGDVTGYAKGLTLATLEGAGHLVPADRPSEARAMMAAWMKGEQLPKYTGPRCKRLWLGRKYSGDGFSCRGGLDEAQAEELAAELVV